MMVDRELKIIREVEDITADVELAIQETVEWFVDGPMPTEDFIDRLCKDYGDGWDIEELDTPAVRKIMRIARSIKNEAAL